MRVPLVSPAKACQLREDSAECFNRASHVDTFVQARAGGFSGRLCLCHI